MDIHYKDVARDTNRGHTVAAVCNSFEQAKVFIFLIPLPDY